MITLCMLNWNRPEILRDAILPTMARYAMIDEIIVSHGREDTRFDFETPDARVVMRDDWGEVNREYGIARRWLCWELARNETVLSLDDDLLLPETSVEFLWRGVCGRPGVMHGTVHMPGADSYMPREAGDAMSVSGAYLAPRALGRACLERAGEAEDDVRDPFKAFPLWDGDDVFASLIARRISGRSNVAHRVLYRNLDVMRPGFNIRHEKLRYVRRAKLARNLAGKLTDDKPAGKGATARMNTPVQTVSRIRRECMAGARMALHKKPSFFIIGAGRGGTSSLFEYLCMHDKVLRPQRKEIGLLAARTSNGVVERCRYRRMYARRAPWRRRAITGEATPQLLHSFAAPYHLKSEFPRARLIVLLRDPVDRVFSSYRLHRQRARAERLEYPSLPEMFKKEEKMLHAGVPPLFVAQWPHIIRHYFPGHRIPSKHHRAYVLHSLYAGWLARYFELFPREQLLVLQSERLFAEPRDVLPKVHEFLELDILPQCRPELFRRVHASPASPDLEAEENAMRPRLLEQFREPNKRLFELLEKRRYYDWAGYGGLAPCADARYAWA